MKRKIIYIDDYLYFKSFIAFNTPNYLDNFYN